MPLWAELEGRRVWERQGRRFSLMWRHPAEARRAVNIARLPDLLA